MKTGIKICISIILVIIVLSLFNIAANFFTFEGDAGVVISIVIFLLIILIICSVRGRIYKKCFKQDIPSRLLKSKYARCFGTDIYNEERTECIVCPFEDECIKTKKKGE